MTEFPEPGRGGLRKFGLTMGMLIALIFGLLLPWAHGRQWPIWPWAVLGGLSVVALALPSALRPIYRGWMKFGAVAGYVNTRIVLGLAFFAIIVPVGVIRRVLGGDPMRRKRVAGPTYRVPSAKHAPDQMERPY